MAFYGLGRFSVRLVLLATAVFISACTTTGRSFDSLALAKFVPGETTFQEAVKLFGAEPDNTYAQLNGSMTARWAYKGSVLTDAIYFRQEVMLRFDPAGRFERVVDTVNVISRPGVPNPPAAQRVINEPTEPVAVQEVERIIIVPASSGKTPVKPAPSKAQLNQPATTLPVQSPATVVEAKPVPGVPVSPTVPAANSPPAVNPASSELEQPLTNPTASYPVPSARKP